MNISIIDIQMKEIMGTCLVVIGVSISSYLSLRISSWLLGEIKDCIYRGKRERSELEFQLGMLRQDVERLERGIEKLKTKNKKR